MLKHSSYGKRSRCRLLSHPEKIKAPFNGTDGSTNGSNSSLDQTVLRREETRPTRWETWNSIRPCRRGSDVRTSFLNEFIGHNAGNFSGDRKTLTDGTGDDTWTYNTRRKKRLRRRKYCLLSQFQDAA